MCKVYESDLTDAQWEMIAPLLSFETGRPAQVDRRAIINAIFYVTHSGCQWRNLPGDFPNWSTVYSCHHRWSWNGTLDKIHDAVRDQARLAAGKTTQPTAGSVDSQSVKVVAKGGPSCLQQRGFDGAKLLTGRKRFVVCDTLGYWMEVLVTPAKVPERAGAEALFWQMSGKEVCQSLDKVWADGGFAGQKWQGQMQEQFGFEIEIIKRSDDAKGFELLPKRWVVERSYGWMNRYRRLSKDYEGHCFLSRSWMLWAMIHKMTNSLHPKPKEHPFRYRCV